MIPQPPPPRNGTLVTPGKWESIPEPFRAEIQDFLGPVLQAPWFMGAYVLGHWADNARDPDSPVRVLVVHDGPGWFIGKRKSGGVRLAVSLERLDVVCRKVIGSTHTDYLQIVANGHLVEDRHPLLAQLQVAARWNLARGALPCSRARASLIRSKYENLQDERVGGTSDDVSRGYLQAWTLHQIAVDCYRLNGWHMPLVTKLLEDLRVRDTGLAGRVHAYLLSHSPEDREEILLALVERVLSPFGGYLPKEWVVREGTQPIQILDDASGNFVNWTPPSLDHLRSPYDAYKIGINEWVARGQDFDGLPSEAFLDYRPRYWWDDAGNSPLPYVNDAVEKVVREYATREHILGILVFGSHGYGVGHARPDSDVDLFLITSRRGDIQERRYVDGIEFGLQFINFTDLYDGVLRRRETGFWRGLKEAKVLFSRHPSVPLMRDLAAAMFEAGMLPMSPDSVVLLRDRLGMSLRDGDNLLERGDITSLLFNDNSLFCTVIQDWFRLHNWLDTKRTYVIREIQAKDNHLRKLVADYLLEWQPALKHRMLSAIVLYVLEPVGGLLPQDWGVPVVTKPPGSSGPTVVSDPKQPSRGETAPPSAES